MEVLKNAKIIPKANGLHLIDAPEKMYGSPDYNGESCWPKECKDGQNFTHFIQSENRYVCTCRYYEHLYQEALSKAPTWEIKKDIYILIHMITGITVPNKDALEDFLQREQGKLYDIPAGYTYEFEYTCNDDKLPHGIKVAILIPKE